MNCFEQLIICALISDVIEIIDMLEGKSYAVTVPIKISSLFMVSQYDWLLTEHQTNKSVWFYQMKPFLNILILFDQHSTVTFIGSLCLAMHGDKVSSNYTRAVFSLLTTLDQHFKTSTSLAFHVL